MANIINSEFKTALLTMTTLTTNASTSDITNPCGRGLAVFLNVTSLGGGAPTAVVALMGKDPVSGLYGSMGSNSALTLVVGVNTVVFYPSATAGTGSANTVVPYRFQIKVTAGGTGSITGTVGACLTV